METFTQENMNTGDLESHMGKPTLNGYTGCVDESSNSI